MQTITKPPKKTARRRQTQRWPFIKKRTYRTGLVGWLVDARTKSGGERRTFETLSDAETFAAQCRNRRVNEGISAFGNAELARYGKSVQDAINYYLAYLRRLDTSKPVKEVIDAFIAEKTNVEKRSRRYLDDLRVRLARFKAAFGDQMIASIDAAAINDWLSALGVNVVTRNTFRRRLAALFSFAKHRKWLVENPFAGGKKAEVKRLDEPRLKVQILAPEKVEQVLLAASDETRPFWAIAFFAGLRPQSELFRLRWEDIDFDQRVITVDGEASEIEETKTGRRVVKMSDNLFAWLRPFRNRTGAVAPGGDSWRKLRKDKRKAGFGTPGTETEKERQVGVKLRRWPTDVTRHTFGSNLLAKCGDIGATATEMGSDPKTVRRWYLALVKPAAAAQFWALSPKK